MSKKITQTYRFSVEPKKVYEAYLSSKEHSEFTGAAAKMSTKEGAKFTAWDGYIWGKNLKLVPGKKIVQEWTCSDFPEGHMSQITLLLAPDKKGVKLAFIHENVPAENYADIKKGWIDNYWDLMESYFKSAK